MPTITANLRGTLHLGDVASGMDCEAQVSNIGVPQTVTRDSPVTVLTGDVVQAAATYSWSLSGTMVIDYADPTGVYYWVHDNQGSEQAFLFSPSGADGPDRGHVCGRRVQPRRPQRRRHGGRQVRVAHSRADHRHPAHPHRSRRRGMSDGVEIRATNGPAFLRALTQATQSVGDMSGPLAAGATMLVAASVAASPRRTGRLAASHRMTRIGRNRVRISVDTPYAAVVHWGWPAHGIRRQPWVVAVYQRDNAWETRMEDEQQAALDKAAGAASARFPCRA